MVKKVLISAVGNHDPWGVNNSTGPVLAAVQDLEPDCLFLFPTREQVDPLLTSTVENSKALIEELKTRRPSCKVYERPLNLPNPTDYKEIIKLLTVEIEVIKKDYAECETEFYISLTSGTPQIQSSFLVLISNNRIKAKVYQVIDPRFLKDGEPRLRLVETHFIEESNQIMRSRGYFQRINFDAAATEMANLALYTAYPEREIKAKTFFDLLTGYFYWDLYQHHEAKKYLEKSVKRIKRFCLSELTAILELQLILLDEIIKAGDVENQVNLFDLYHNAERRLDCKQYVDCLSRFKRIYEGAFYYVAREQLGIDVRKSLEQLPEAVRSDLNKERGFLYAHDVSVLYEIRKNERLISKELEKKLDKFAYQRNNTINNHGMNSVSEDQARQALGLAGVLLEGIFNKELSKYPFSNQVLKDVGEAIFNEL